MFDARLTPAGLSNADLETLRQFGVKGALVFASTVERVDAVAASWDAAQTELVRLRALGFDVVTCASVPVVLGGKKGVAALVAALPKQLGERGVMALGPLMLHRGTEDEAELFLEQLTIARKLARPVIVSAPIARHDALTTKTLALLHQSKLKADRVLVDGLTVKSVRSVLARGHLAGLTLHPDRLDVDLAERLVHALGPARLVIGSGAGDGPSDLLALPRLVSRLKLAKLSGGVRNRVSGKTLRAFLGLNPP
ncbi:MAG: hydrolase TatD [Myxococcales bacterium]|nr:hydrolase TatD [Myxococcales bacterium]MDP3499817.1 hydrolase TatD [Myxococcales bacterium]